MFNFWNNDMTFFFSYYYINIGLEKCLMKVNISSNGRRQFLFNKCLLQGGSYISNCANSFIYLLYSYSFCMYLHLWKNGLDFHIVSTDIGKVFNCFIISHLKGLSINQKQFSAWRRICYWNICYFFLLFT